MKPSILIADDEPNQLELMAYNLKKADFVIHQAENGEEALEKVEELNPDLVILDWMMPNMSGIEVCRILRSKVETKKIPIIILSARSEDVDKSLGLDTGADDYISKPFDPDELAARVKNVINRQERLLKEAARFADIDVSKMAKQITEIKSMLTDQNQTNPENKINLPSFTPREASVLQLVAEGLMNKEIARKLETSIRNVEKYVSRLFIKTGTSSRTELVRYALENHLVK